MTAINLPFELTTDAVSSWLHSFDEKNTTHTALELNNICKLLRQYKNEYSAVLNTLNQLTPTILHICQSIESSFIEMPEHNRSSTKIIRLSIQLLRNTAFAFSSLCHQDSLNEDERKLSVFMALQFIGQTQEISAVFHESPSTSLWTESGNLYNIALRKGFLTQQINHKIKQYKALPSIESVIKRNILFNISNPYQYTPREIKQLFEIANQCADKLAFNPHYSEAVDTFQWDPGSDHAPASINYSKQNRRFNLTINSRDLIEFMQSKAFQSGLTSEAFSALLDQLSGYQNLINNPIPSPPTISRLVIGFSEIITHLTKINKLKKIQLLSSEPLINQPLDSIALEPIAFEKRDRHNQTPVNTSKNNANLLVHTTPVKTIKVSNERYIIAESNDINCNIGDLILFCSVTLNHQLGIIRQARIINSTGTVHILIEEISGIPDYLVIKSPELVENQVISIQHNLKPSELFIQPNKLTNYTVLTNTLDQNYVLEKIVDHSPYFIRYAISR